MSGYDGGQDPYGGHRGTYGERAPAGPPPHSQRPYGQAPHGQPPYGVAPSDPWAVAASEGAWSPWGHGGRDKNWQGTWALVFGILGFAGPPAVAGLLFLLASADAAPSALVGIFGGLLLLYGTPVAVVGFGFAALILGLIGRGSARRGRATNGGVATGGAVLGGLLILLAFAGAILIGVGLNQFLSFVSQGF